MNRLGSWVSCSLIGRLTEWSGITSPNPCQTSVHRNSERFSEGTSALILPGLASLSLRCSSCLYIAFCLLCGPCIAWWTGLRWHVVLQTCWLWNDSVVCYRHVSWPMCHYLRCMCATMRIELLICFLSVSCIGRYCCSRLYSARGRSKHTP